MPKMKMTVRGVEGLIAGSLRRSFLLNDLDEFFVGLEAGVDSAAACLRATRRGPPAWLNLGAIVPPTDSVRVLA